MNLKIILTFFLITLIFGCSASSETTDKNNVSTTHDAHYNSNNLEITIPSGWREIKDNSEQLFEIWLVSEDNNSVIGFIPINLDSALKSNSIDDQLETIGKIITNNRESTSNSFDLIEVKKIDSNYKINISKFIIDGITQTSLLFGNGSNFYECLSYFKKDYEPASSEIENLIDVQTKIVTECSIK